MPAGASTPGDAADAPLRLLHLEAEARAQRAAAADAAAALDKARRRVAGLEDVLEETEAETLALKARADDAAARAAALADALAARDAELAAARAAADQAAAETEAGDGVAAMEQQLRDGAGELARAREENQALRAEVAAAKGVEAAAAVAAAVAAEEAGVACKAAEEEADVLKRQLAERAQALDAAAREASEASAEKDALAKEIGELQAHAQASEVAAAELKAAEAETSKAVTEILAEREALEGELAAVKAAAEEGVLEAQRDAAAAMGELQTEVEAMQEKLNLAETRLSHVAAAGADSLRSLKSVKAERDAKESFLQQQIDDLSLDRDELSAFKRDAEARSSQDESDKQVLQRTVAELTAERDLLASSNSTAESDKGKLGESIAAFKQEIAVLASSRDELAGTVKTGEQANEALKSRILALETDNADGLARLASSNEKVDRLSKQLEALEAENIDIQKHIANSNDLMQQMETQGTEMSERTAAAVASANASRASAARRADVAEERQKAIATALASVDSKLVALTGSDVSSVCLEDDLSTQLEHIDDCIVAVESRFAAASSLEGQVRDLSNKNQVFERSKADLEEKYNTLKEKALADASAAAERLSAVEASSQEVLSGLDAVSQKLFHLSGVDASTAIENDLPGHLKSVDDAAAALEFRYSEVETTSAAAIARADEERCAAYERANAAEEGHREIEAALQSIYTRLIVFATTDSSATLPSDLSGQLEHIDDAVKGVESFSAKMSTLESEIRSVAEERDDLEKAKQGLEQKCKALEEESQAIVDAANQRAHAAEADYNAAVSSIEAASQKLCSLPGVEVSSTVAEIDLSRLEVLATATREVEALLATSSALREKVSAMSGDVASLKAANVNLNEKTVALESEKAELVGKLASCAKSIADLEKEARKFSADRRNQEDTVAGLRSDLQEVQREAEAALEEQEAASAERLRDSERAFEVTLSNLRATQAALESALEKRIEQVEELRARDDEAAKTLGEVLADKDVLKHQVTDTQDEIERLNGKLRAQVAESQETVEHLHNELERIGSIRASESQTQEKLVDDAVCEAETWHGKCGALEEELREVKSQLLSAKANLASSRTCLKVSHLQSAALLVVVAESEKKACKVEETDFRAEKATAEVARLQREVLRVKQDLSSNFETELQLAEESFNEAVQEHADEKASLIDRHVKELQEHRMNSEQALVQARDESERLSSEIELLRCEAKASISDLKKKRDYSETQMKSLEVRLQNASGLSEKLKAEKNLVQEELDSLKLSSQKLLADLSEAQEQAASLTEDGKVSEEKLAHAREAITALEEQLSSVRIANEAAGDQRDDEVTALQIALSEAKAREASHSDNVSKVRHECNAATSRVAFLESKVVTSLEQDIKSLREEESDLQTMISDRDIEISVLKESMASLEQEVSNGKDSEERLRLADAAIAAKDAVAEKQTQASKDLRGDNDQLRAALNHRESSFADVSARMSTLESEDKAKDESMRALTQKLEERSRLHSEAEATVSDLKSKLNALEQDLQSKSTQCSTEPAVDSKAELLYEALEKYDEALVKENRLRKRARKFEALLAAERAKNAKLVAANSDLVAASKLHIVDNADCTDRDNKRQVSPSTKGMSPSVKRARDQVFRTPLSPMATNNRPPLAPRPRQ